MYTHMLFCLMTVYRSVYYGHGVFVIECNACAIDTRK